MRAMRTKEVRIKKALAASSCFELQRSTSSGGLRLAPSRDSGAFSRKARAFWAIPAGFDEELKRWYNTE
jgi:hypothetical protein